MIALDLQHRRAVEHPLQGKLLLRELKILKSTGYELHKDITIVLSDEIDDVQTLQLTLDHQYVLLGFDHHLGVV